MTVQLPGHFAEELDKLVSSSFKEIAAENYNQLPTMIPEVAHIEPLREAGSPLPLYREKVVRVEDYMLEEVEIGDGMEAGSLMEARTHVIKTRKYAKKWEYIKEVLEARGLDWMRQDLITSAADFGRQLGLMKEREVAKLYNKGGYTAGHAIFNNHVPGMAASGIANGLLFDGKPLFNLSGNTRSNWLATTYYNATANSLSAANITTAKILVNKTNAKDELDREFQQRANTLMVPPALEDTAFSIVEAAQYHGSANYGGNPFGDLRVLVWNLLDDADAWYLMARTDMGQAGRGPRGIVVYDDPAGVETFWTFDPDTGKVTVYAQVYMGLYCYDWRAVSAHALATS